MMLAGFVIGMFALPAHVAFVMLGYYQAATWAAIALVSSCTLVIAGLFNAALEYFK